MADHEYSPPFDETHRHFAVEPAVSDAPPLDSSTHSPVTPLNDMSSGRRGGQRSGTNRPKGRTKEQLYNEAKRRGIKGRSRMNKAQLQRAVAAKS